MNYVAYSGYWFYDAATPTEMAALFSSYGLLTTAPAPPSVVKRIVDWFWEFF